MVVSDFLLFQDIYKLKRPRMYSGAFSFLFLQFRFVQNFAGITDRLYIYSGTIN